MKADERTEEFYEELWGATEKAKEKIIALALSMGFSREDGEDVLMQALHRTALAYEVLRSNTLEALIKLVSKRLLINKLRKLHTSRDILDRYVVDVEGVGDKDIPRDPPYASDDGYVEPRIRALLEMSEEDVRTFDAVSVVLSTSSITEAAEIIGISQQGLSKRLKTIRERIDRIVSSGE